jgi:L-alanine-DL-glutamate epimerase-like enolase superfamily enzyme
MKITAVEAILLSCPMPQTIHLPFWGGVRRIVKRDAMLVRIRTDRGITGYAPGPAHERARTEINTVIREFLRDKDPLRWRSFQFEANRDLMKTYRAVEIALLDIQGQYEGCAVSEILGGRQRQAIKLYGSAGMYMAPERYADEAAAIQDLGFPAYKMRPALGPEEDLRTVELMRKATSPDFGLMIDAHTWWRMGDLSYTEETVTDLAREMARFQPVWLEEPLPPDDHDRYEQLTSRNIIPVASGEHEQDLTGFYDLIDRRAVHYVQADVCCQGGFELGARIFAATEQAGLRFAFHCWGTTLEVLASAHLGICWPETVVEWLEYPCYSTQDRPGMYPFPLSEALLKEPLDIQNGYLEISDRPGLGIAIDESVIDQYPFIPGPWSFFDQKAPRQTVAVTGDHSIKWVPENQIL